MLSVLQGLKIEVHGWGVPQSTKQAWVPGPKDVGPSKSVQGDLLFLKTESEDRVEGWANTAKLEAPMVG